MLGIVVPKAMSCSCVHIFVCISFADDSCQDVTTGDFRTENVAVYRKSVTRMSQGLTILQTQNVATVSDTFVTVFISGRAAINIYCGPHTLTKKET